MIIFAKPVLFGYKLQFISLEIPVTRKHDGKSLIDVFYCKIASVIIQY